MFNNDYVCLNGHPVLPGGKFCMHCGSRVASGAAVRAERASSARRPVAVKEVPDGFAVVPEGFKLVPIPQPMSDAEINEMVAAPAVELVESPQIVADDPMTAKSFETPELNVVDDAPVAVKELNGIAIDEDLASWLNEDMTGWRMPELDVEEPVVAETPAAAEADDEDPFGGPTISFGLFPFGGMSVIRLGGTRPMGATGVRTMPARRSGFGLFLLPMVMFMLLSMLGSAFSGPNTNVTMFPGGMIVNTVPMDNGTGPATGGGADTGVTP